jgi:WD40 repeat protein
MSNVTNLNKSENNYSFTSEGRLYYLLITTAIDRIRLQLKEEHSILNYVGDMGISELKKEKLFMNCYSMQDYETSLDEIISEGNIVLEVLQNSIFKLSIFYRFINKYNSFETILKEEKAEEMSNENVLHNIDYQLKAIFALLEDRKTEQLLSIKDNKEEMKALKEELLNNKKIIIKASEERMMRAIASFDNVMTQPYSVDSLTEKINLYKDVLICLDDGETENWLKDRFIFIYNEMCKEFTSYKIVKEELSKYKAEAGFTKSFKEEFEELGKEFKFIKEGLSLSVIKGEENLMELSKKVEELIKLGEEKFIQSFKIQEQQLRQSITALNNCNASVQFRLNSLSKNISNGFSAGKKIVRKMNLKIEENKENLLRLYNVYSNEIVDKIRLNHSKLNNTERLITDLTNSMKRDIHYINNDIKQEITSNSLIAKNNIKLEEKLKTMTNNVILEGHIVKINSIILLSSGYIASASTDKTIKIWDINKYICIKTLADHTKSVTCLALLSEGEFASGSADCTIKIWDCKNNYQCVRTISAHASYVSSLLFLRNWKLVSGSHDKTIKIWNDNYECEHTIGDAHKSIISSLINLADGFFASSSHDTTFKIWDANYKIVNILNLDKEVYCLALLPFGDIASGTTDIEIWKCNNDYKEVERIRTIIKSNNFVHCLAMFNNNYLVSGIVNTPLKFWDIYKDFKEINILQKDYVEAGSAIVVLNDNRIVSGSRRSFIRIWNTDI